MYYIRGRKNAKIAVHDSNTGSKQTVVFIYGWALSAEVFEYRKQFLIEHGFHVVYIFERIRREWYHRLWIWLCNFCSRYTYRCALTSAKII